MAGMETPHISELIRRLENLLRPGTIGRVDVQRARVRVRAGGIVSNWLPWFTLRAGSARHWSAPSIGEQCMLLAPGGDLANGVVLVGIFSQASPPNDNRDHTHATHYPDGSFAEYDHKQHRALLQCVGDIESQAEGAMRYQAQGPIVIESGQSITLRVGGASIVLTASGASVDPDIVGGGRVSLVKHKHGQVRSGLDVSGPPA